MNRHFLSISRIAALLIALAGTEMRNLRAESPVMIRVMSFNLWLGGEGGKQPLEQSAAVIRAGKADVVGLQEGEGLAPEGQPKPDNGAKLAQMLGWHHFKQAGGTELITRYKILSHSPHRHGICVELPGGHKAYLFNVHLNSSPYQPYQLLNIPYGDAKFLKTEEEAIAAANEVRAADMKEVLADVQALAGEKDIVTITGDFNEPSHQDWSMRAVEARFCPIKVAWPTTHRVTDAGFVDSFRACFPDEIKHRGLTWTPITKISDPADHHDRIDFVFVRGAKPRSVEIVGESRDSADIVVSPYPSDHRAVVAEIELPAEK